MTSKKDVLKLGKETVTIDFKEAGGRYPFNPLDATKEKDFIVSDPAADRVNHLVIGEGKIPNNEGMDKQRVLGVLNSLEVIESEGGESAYILVEASKDNIEWMNSVGIANEILDKYIDGNTIDILALAAGERIAHLHRYGRLVQSTDIYIDDDDSINIYDLNGSIIMEGEGREGVKWKTMLSPEERRELKKLL